MHLRPAYENDYLARCPAYQDHICSLRCSLEARCDDLCKLQGRLGTQWAALQQRPLPGTAQPYLEAGLGNYRLLMAGLVPFLGLGLLYYQEVLAPPASDATLREPLRGAFLKVAVALLLLSGIVAWWQVLTQKIRAVAQE